MAVHNPPEQDEYTDIGALTGRITRSKKGDGLLTVTDADARVVLEMTDSQRSGPGQHVSAAFAPVGRHLIGV